MDLVAQAPPFAFLLDHLGAYQDCVRKLDTERKNESAAEQLGWRSRIDVDGSEIFG